jgi:outer membrane protein
MPWQFRGWLMLAGLLSTGAVTAATAPPPPAPVGTTQDGTTTALPELSLIDAVALALQHNFALRASALDISISDADVGIARSQLLPQIDVSLRGRRIDDDRATAGVGHNPEYQSFGAASLSQTLYSDKLLSSYQVQRMLAAARRDEHQGQVLDTVLAAASAFLNLLRSEALLQVDRHNLAVTESNYQRAQSRLDLGVGTRSELYRWETARANAHGNVVGAEATAKQSLITLNRIINAPLGNRYATETPTLDAPYFMVSAPEIRAELARPGGRTRLEQYFVEQTLRGAPELQALREQIDARNRRLLATKRAFYLPEVTAHAGVDYELERGGAGTQQVDFSRLFPGALGGITNNTDWLVGVEARLPLYQGGGRSADRDRARAELDQESLRYDEVALNLQAGVLQQALATEARFDQISYTRTAATAGRSNLMLVTEAYERGVMTVTDLVDAQFSAFNAEQNAANAVYDFLIDYLKLQRYTGEFDITATDQQRREMQQNLKAALAP